jgi:protein-S-isoprenylcysteine O-methyltransferase Ste14
MGILLIIQIVVFTLGTIFIILISKRSLQSLKYHGFYRFFVFEFTFVMLLLNIPHWFENTVSLIQKGVYKYIRHPMYGSLLFLAFSYEKL